MNGRQTRNILMRWGGIVALAFIVVLGVAGQNSERAFDVNDNVVVQISNPNGKVLISASDKNDLKKVLIRASSPTAFLESDLKFVSGGTNLTVSVAPQNPKSRIDLDVRVPFAANVRIKTNDGEVRLSGTFSLAHVETETGTISTDIPLDYLRYNFLWNSSSPRFLSDLDLGKVKEKSAGRFQLSGIIGAPAKVEGTLPETAETDVGEDNPDSSETAQSNSNGSKKKKEKEPKRMARISDAGLIRLEFTTERGIVLLNVNPAEVPSDLRMRPLTSAAKAIIRSGDGLLMSAIRRASPKYFGDYAKTLPPRKSEPTLRLRQKSESGTQSNLKRATVKVTDVNNRAIGGLTKNDFKIFENGTAREVIEVETSTSPFNLVLLLDVSGSVENYVDFIRKAARDFINTVEKHDRIALVTFGEDTQTLSTFSTDRQSLLKALDTFDAGGGTAYYDALAFSLVDTLSTLRGERSAIVVLTDGDDNRSFLSFESLLGSIQESGAMIYPLYVPSGLIAASKSSESNRDADPLRRRYMSLTSRAEGEGAKLSQISGGVYYPIRRIEEIQRAYDDIVAQLRTAYTVTFRSTIDEGDGRASPRLKIETNRRGAFVNVSTVIDVSAEKVTQREPQPTSPTVGNDEIRGTVDSLQYKPMLIPELREIPFAKFNVNTAPPSFVVAEEQNKIAVSRWISPKRTRSYPYERVYNTLGYERRAAVIPLVKDEGVNGDRDFMQWDTFSLMTLLNVFVIPAYYNEARAATGEGKITDQKFDSEYVNQRISALKDFKGSALEWNLEQIRELPALLAKVRNAYSEISRQTGVALHDENGLEDFSMRIKSSLDEFMRISRLKAQGAQNREFQTLQPKEALSSDTKGRITISDSNGGMYFFTCDETRLEENTLTLMEAKHTRRGKYPNESDIKDGLLKLMLYTNLRRLSIGTKLLTPKIALRLTASRLAGSVTSDSTAEDFNEFASKNLLTTTERSFFDKLFAEARENKFQIILEHADNNK